MAYRDIDFGLTDAMSESREHPDLLLEGYFDLHDAERLLRSRHFLLLGRKGCGKSAVFEHMRLKAKSTENEFVEVVRLGSFPFSDFAALDSGGATDPTRYAASWRIVILLQLIRSLRNDYSASGSASKQFTTAVSRLENVGLLESRDLRSLVLKISKRGIGGTLAAVTGTAEVTEQAAGRHYQGLDQSLMAVVEGFLTPNLHVICVDGLDDIVFMSNAKLEIIGALIEAVAEINSDLVDSGVPAKVVVACRTDWFGRLRSSNSNKYRQDNSVVLSWYDDPRHPEQNPLMALVDRKASVSHELRRGVIGDFFPVQLQLPSAVNVETYRYLLSYTRHTPRDMLKLLRSIQEFCLSDSPPKLNEILNGIRKYSESYFVNEIKNELGENVDDFDKVVRLLRQHERQVFTYSDLMEVAQSSGGIRGGQLRQTLELLYECSAIGNVTSGRTRYYTFKYRNENTALATGQPMLVHSALARGLNLRLLATNTESGVLIEPGAARVPPADRRPGRDRKRGRRKDLGGGGD